MGIEFFRQEQAGIQPFPVFFQIAEPHAPGTQKRYEEKIKAKKKAEIEAKKAAIHAEDMEKGVFIPASSLPKKEPQKAPMPARAAM